MPTRATATFTVTGWDPTPYDEDVAGPRLSRATVRKTFLGDLTAESTAQLLMCQADLSDLSAGAGYVASERVVGRLGDRRGSAAGARHERPAMSCPAREPEISPGSPGRSRLNRPGFPGELLSWVSSGLLGSPDDGSRRVGAASGAG
ncbi:MAG: DUF3224 domain-containing protein [Gemmatimonadota bacterium]|nr:DUF3224 domain-containing protein [Gemmatimonadota bacterium]MDH4351235.1 DUF3224 domain-containing protein [Gemmatimonadota bacterium]MDH5196583.1 DUF3224 domain-containing protein [Gemmatimonadota bacterium]